MYSMAGYKQMKGSYFNPISTVIPSKDLCVQVFKLSLLRDLSVIILQDTALWIHHGYHHRVLHLPVFHTNAFKFKMGWCIFRNFIIL